MTKLFNHRGRVARAAALGLLGLAAVLFQAREARAQWTQPDAAGNMSSTNTGNVGVGGATTPTDTLSVWAKATDAFGFRVSGGGQASGAATNAGVHIRPDATKYGYLSFTENAVADRWVVGIKPSDGNLYFSSGASTLPTAASRVVFSAGGNVGIGTAEPTDRLEINGNVANGAGLTISTSGLAKYRLGTVGTNVPNWGGQLINAKYNQATGTWTMDDATLSAAFLKLDLRNHAFGNEIGFYRMAGAANPRPDTAWSPVAQFKLDTGNVLLAPSSGNIGIGASNPNYKLVVGPELPSGFVYGTMTVSKGANASSSIIVGESGSRLAEVGWDNPNGRAFLNAAGTTPIAITQNGSNVRMFVTGGGDIGVGTTTPASKLHVVGDITVTGNINAKYQDVAEWVPSTQKLSAGTVVVLDTGRDNHVLASHGAYDTRVAGVISAQPGLSLGEKGEGKALVATTGRVKVKVDATRSPIRIGDLIVTSDMAGVAMKSEPVSFGGVAMHRPGTIIGKALESLEKGTGEILVLLSLQ